MDSSSATPATVITTHGQHVPDTVLKELAANSPVLGHTAEELMQHPPVQSVLQHNEGLAPNTVTSGAGPDSQGGGLASASGQGPTSSGLETGLEGLQQMVGVFGPTCGPGGCASARPQSDSAAAPAAAMEQQQQPPQRQWEDLFPETQEEAMRGADAQYY